MVSDYARQNHNSLLSNMHIIDLVCILRMQGGAEGLHLGGGRSELLYPCRALADLQWGKVAN